MVTTKMNRRLPLQDPKSHIHNRHIVSSRLSRFLPPSLFTLRSSLFTTRGQALLELAAFGSLVILVLGALVNYGLNADFTQQATMRAFRQSLASASEATGDGRPSSVSYLRLDERHVPNPSHPFAIGSLLPMPAEARSVTRNFQTQEVGDEVEELPRMRMILQDQEINCPSANPAGGVFGCATSGFRVEDPVPPDSLKRYVDIYGRSNVCDKTSCGGVCLERDRKTKECKKVKRLRIIDRCEGEIISSFEDCVRQARQIVDSHVCATLCEKGRAPGSPINCPEICQQPMNVPWYAQFDPDKSDPPNHRYVFPKLESLFAGVKVLGLQPAYAKTTTTETTLSREDCVRDLRTHQCVEEEEDEEKRRETQTTSHVVWNDTTTRTVIYKPLEDESGVPATLPEADTTTTPKHEDSTRTWTTPWN